MSKFVSPETCKIVEKTNAGNKNSPRNVIDGTICNYDSTHRCFEGKCTCFLEAITHCHHIFDNFKINSDPQETFHQVLSIPTGSLNVEVKAEAGAHILQMGEYSVQNYVERLF